MNAKHPEIAPFVKLLPIHWSQLSQTKREISSKSNELKLIVWKMPLHIKLAAIKSASLNSWFHFCWNSIAFYENNFVPSLQIVQYWNSIEIIHQLLYDRKMCKEKKICANWIEICARNLTDLLRKSNWIHTRNHKRKLKQRKEKWNSHHWSNSRNFQLNCISCFISTQIHWFYFSLKWHCLLHSIHNQNVNIFDSMEI